MRRSFLAGLAACLLATGATPASTAAYVDETPTVRLMAVGDVMLGWEVGRRIVRNGPAWPWRGVQGYFDAADLVVGNLECVIARGGEKWPTKRVHLRAPLRATQSLVAAGFDVVSVANNHSFDFGAGPFLSTLARLDANGVRHAGGGVDAGAARDAEVVSANGLKIAFLGYLLPMALRPDFHSSEWQATDSTPGLAIGTPAAVAEDVALARQFADLVIVMVHGGRELRSEPDSAQRGFAQAAVDAGAALVLGHHPHVLQGYTAAGSSLIAYSLGNFVFSRFDGAANDSAILDVTLSEDGVQSFRFIPVAVQNGVPRPAVGAEVDRIQARLQPI